MVRMTRGGRAFALLTLLVALALPASVASAGPSASKSGALINYVTTGKLKIAKRIEIVVVCSQNCNATSVSRIKGPGVNVPGTVSGSLQAGVPGGPFFKPNGPLLKALRARPGRYRLVNKITATDPVTGFSETISRTFRFKR